MTQPPTRCSHRIDAETASAGCRNGREAATTPEPEIAAMLAASGTVRGHAAVTSGRLPVAEAIVRFGPDPRTAFVGGAVADAGAKSAGAPQARLVLSKLLLPELANILLARSSLRKSAARSVHGGERASCDFRWDIRKP
jgi:hypothetical protein